MALSIPEAIQRAHGHFCQDVAAQLRMAADRAGLPAIVTVDQERVVLAFDEALPDGALPRVIAGEFSGRLDRYKGYRPAPSPAHAGRHCRSKSSRR